MRHCEPDPPSQHIAATELNRLPGVPGVFCLRFSALICGSVMFILLTLEALRSAWKAGSRRLQVLHIDGDNEITPCSIQPIYQAYNTYK